MISGTSKSKTQFRPVKSDAYRSDDVNDMLKKIVDDLPRLEQPAKSDTVNHQPYDFDDWSGAF